MSEPIAQIIAALEGRYSIERQIVEGGIMPVWAHSGQEIFFMDRDNRMVSAEVRTDPGFEVGDRQGLFDASEYRANASNILVSESPDDERFLMARWAGGADAGPRFVLVNNFFEVLRQRVRN
jgi:hypothetical protein